MTSKKSKTSKFFDHTAKNFIVRCNLLILPINDFTLFLPASRHKNMSSMYLHHKYGLNSDFFTVSLSSSAMNKMLYGGAILVPITVPRFYLSIFFRM